MRNILAALDFSHGHGVIRRALLGSVSEHVLHQTRRPLLILPAPAA